MEVVKMNELIWKEAHKGLAESQVHQPATEQDKDMLIPWVNEHAWKSVMVHSIGDHLLHTTWIIPNHNETRCKGKSHRTCAQLPKKAHGVVESARKMPIPLTEGGSNAYPALQHNCPLHQGLLAQELTKTLITIGKCQMRRASPKMLEFSITLGSEILQFLCETLIYLETWNLENLIMVLRYHLKRSNMNLLWSACTNLIDPMVVMP